MQNKKPVLLCSDSHKLDDIGTSFSWIKAESTFEGLKQIIYDPQFRIVIKDNKPVHPNNSIDSITFNIPNYAKISVKQTYDQKKEKEEKFCFSGVNNTFYLSPFFNCFIGGRGSGKSTILNFLGNFSKNPNSSQKFWDKIQPSFEIKNNFSFEGVSFFEFIGQSEVEKFA